MENQYENEEDIIEESGPTFHDSESLEKTSFQEPQEEELEEEVQEKRRHRPPAYNRIQEIQREKYQALDELNRMREENEQLRRVAQELNYKAEESGNAAMVHYDKSMALKLEQAKIKKAQALENGDIQAQLDADVEISEATNAIQNINSWRYQQEVDMRKRMNQERWQEEQVQQYQQQPVGPDPNVGHTWLENNTWFAPQSDNFDPEMAEAAKDYSEKVENFLYRNGRPDLIMSQDYFNEIDRYINSLRQNSGRSNFNMRPSQSGVSAVRNSMGGGSRRQTVQLTADEKDMARRSGVKEEDFLRAKINDIKRFGNTKRLYGR